ncbi:hypothetical protein AO058_09520 [Salegentibacter sp. T436]|nr:hypothetical protein AO058_09520 [Salegentibacter sp. T436]
MVVSALHFFCSSKRNEAKKKTPFARNFLAKMPKTVAKTSRKSDKKSDFLNLEVLATYSAKKDFN